MLQSVASSPTREGARIGLLTELSSPYLTVKRVIPSVASMCVAQLRKVEGKLAAPFRMSVRGVIVDVPAPDVSQAGKAQRSFNIVEEPGAWIACCALGRIALSKALQNGLGIVLFFGAGRRPLVGSPGSLCAMKGSLIIAVCMYGATRKQAGHRHHGCSVITGCVR